MKISQLIHCSIIALITVSFFSCVKTIPFGGNSSNDTTVVNNKQICDPQHSCPIGYSCDSGYCKKIIICDCSARPILFECAWECGP
jgi:hypothetical protein